MPDDLRPHVAGAPSHGVAQARRVGVAVVPGPRPRQDAVGGDERVEGLDLVHIDDLHVKAHIGGDPLDMFEPVQVLLLQRETDAAGGVPADGLASEGLQSLIQGDAVLVDLGEIVIAHHVGALARRVPGGAGGQFAFLKQQRVGATLLRQVVEQAHPHDAAANDDDARVTIHPAAPQSAPGKTDFFLRIAAPRRRLLAPSILFKPPPKNQDGAAPRPPPAPAGPLSEMERSHLLKKGLHELFNLV